LCCFAFPSDRSAFFLQHSRYERVRLYVPNEKRYRAMQRAINGFSVFQREKIEVIVSPLIDSHGAASLALSQ
jgi:hypothetical protein